MSTSPSKCCNAPVHWEHISGIRVYRTTKRGTKIYRVRCSKCWRSFERRREP